MTNKNIIVDDATGASSFATMAELAAQLPAVPAQAAWGGITGTLSAQTDLQAAFDAKQAAGSYATAAQGAKADSAVQPAGLTKAAVGLGNADDTSDATKPVSTAQQTALNLKANLAGAAFTGAITTTTTGIGYAAGAGGTVTQATNKATGVTLNKLTGAITMNGAALAAAAEVSFTVTNNQVAATDAVIVNHASAGTGGAYAVHAHTIGAGSFRIMVGNMSAGSLSEAIVIRFLVIKGVSA